MKKNQTSQHDFIINQDEIQWASFGHGEKFESRNKRLGTAAGASQLGCSLFEVKPGKCAFPHHAHSRNEEAIYILEGKGMLRMGSGKNEKQIEIKSGDYISLLPDLNKAHQLINTSDQKLRYLCISTTYLPEVVIYPDSRKAGMMVEADKAPMDWPTTRGRAFKLLEDSESLDYFKDE